MPLATVDGGLFECARCGDVTRIGVAFVDTAITGDIDVDIADCDCEWEKGKKR